jgi:hypothetical protein
MMDSRQGDRMVPGVMKALKRILWQSTMGRGPYVSTGLAEDVIFGLMFKYTKKPAM